MSKDSIIPFKRYEEIVSVSDFLSDEEIDDIHTYALTLPSTDGVMIGPKGEPYSGEARESKVAWINPAPEISWLFAKLGQVISAANDDCFHLEILGTEPLQYTTYYSPTGHYDSHKDARPHATIVRKISFSIQLTDPETYVGGDVNIYNVNFKQPFTISKQKGSITFFLSNILHEITPITEGTRQSLVGWVSGPPLK